MGAAGFPRQGHSARPGSVPATDVRHISGLTVPTSVCDAVGTRRDRVLTPVLALDPSECKLPSLARATPSPPRVASTTTPTWRHIGVASGPLTPICLHVGVVGGMWAGAGRIEGWLLVRGFGLLMSTSGWSRRC